MSVAQEYHEYKSAHDCKEVSTYLISASEDNFLPMAEQVQIGNFSAV